MAAPTPAASDVAARGGNAPGAVAAACPRERRIALKASSPPTLAAVIQFWTLALRRVPATLMAAATAMRATETTWGGRPPRGTMPPRYPENATARVATDPLEMTAKLAQPYRKAGSGPKASRR